MTFSLIMIIICVGISTINFCMDNEQRIPQVPKGASPNRRIEELKKQESPKNIKFMHQFEAVSGDLDQKNLAKFHKDNRGQNTSEEKNK